MPLLLWLVNLPLFTLTVDYISAGQSKTDTLNIGTYVNGDIKIRVYDVNINFIGGKPNLVGNLLNEGNTVGLFTTVELANTSLSKVSSYIASSSVSWRFICRFSSSF